MANNGWNRSKSSITKKESVRLYMKMIENTITGSGLVRLSFLSGMISKEQYADFLVLEEMYPETSDG